MILLEDSWEADDIKEYASRHHIDLIEMTPDELYAMSSDDFIHETYFCNTDIVQYHLRKLGLETKIIPDCYDSRFGKFYQRQILKMPFSEIGRRASGLGSKLPVFVKPYANDKSFDGTVYSGRPDDFFGGVPPDDILCYVAEPIKILSEYRLLVGNGKKYGIGYICGVRMDDIPINPYINAAGNSYLCIDIGLTKNGWVVVEINPPFSLDDHDIQLDDYMAFCIDACAFITGTYESRDLSGRIQAMAEIDH
jgi:hypothetical protein